MKRTHRLPLLLTLCLSLVMLIGMTMTMTVGAAEADGSDEAVAYNVWVGGTQGTSENKDNVLGDFTVSYDPGTQTLNLRGASDFPGKMEGALIYSQGIDLTVTGRGQVVGASGVNAAIGIRVMGGSLTVNGGITAEGTMYAMYSQQNITIAGGAVVATGTNYGVFANRAMSVSSEVAYFEASGRIKAVYGRDGLTLGEGLAVALPEGGVNEDSGVYDANGNAAKAIRIEGDVDSYQPTATVTFAGKEVCDVVYTVEVPLGLTVADVFNSLPDPQADGFDKVYREVERYGFYYYADYYSYDEEGQELFTCYDLIMDDTVVYASWDTAIEQVTVQVQPVYCGTEVTTPMDGAAGEWHWNDQTGSPTGFTVNTHCSIFYGYEGEGKGLYWEDENGEALNNVVLQGGVPYRAEILLIPDEGYYLRPNAEVRVNGADLISFDFSELAFIGVVKAEVTPIHIFDDWKTVKEATTSEEGQMSHSCTVCGVAEYASIPRRTDGATVTLDFGEGHEAFVEKLYGKDHVVDGSKVIFAESTGTLTGDFTYAQNSYIYDTMGFYFVDNGEKYIYEIGPQPLEAYDSVEDYREDYYAIYKEPLYDGLTLYVHWAKPMEGTVDISVEPIDCTTALKVVEKDEYFDQSPTPVMTVNGDVDLVPLYDGGGQDTYWVTFEWFFPRPKEGTYNDSEMAYALVVLASDFGTYIPRSALHVTGGTVASTETGAAENELMVYIEVPVTHNFHEVEGTGEEPSSDGWWQKADRNCSLCGLTVEGEWMDPLPVELSLTFDAGEGSGSMDALTFMRGDYVILPDCDFEAPEGKSFVGWQIEKVGFNAGEGLYFEESYTALAIYKGDWEMLQSQINAAEDGATITLQGDVKALATDTALVIPAGKSLTLDLNGYTLDRGLTEAAANGNAITVNGTLTITGDGTITGCYNSGSGGAIANKGQLTIESGTFTGNVGLEAGAVFNPSGATLNIQGGTFTGNSASKYGGGAVVNYGTMSMSGGLITGNTVPINGGGIWSFGSLTLSGGEISGNTGINGGGIYYKGGELILSGNPVVKDNTPNNVNMLTGTVITVGGPMTEGANIGVRTESSAIPNRITTGLSGNGDATAFFSDTKELEVQLDESGEAVLALFEGTQVENLTWDGHVASWEYDGPNDELICSVSYTYTYYRFDDTDHVHITDGTLMASFDGEKWSCDFTPIVENVEIANMGIFNYFISYLNPTGGEGFSPIAYQGQMTVHAVLDLGWTTVDADGVIAENGGTIELEGPGYYFDGETINLSVTEEEGYKLTLLAHPKGTARSFVIEESDDMFFIITGQFAKVTEVTLETGDVNVAKTIAGKHEGDMATGKPALGAPQVGYEEGSTQLTYYVPYNMSTKTFYEKYLAEDVLYLVGNSRFYGVAPQNLDAYSSLEEIAESRDALPEKITEESTWYILWAQPVRNVEITVEPLAPGTMVSSVTDADGKTIQNPAPVATYAGEAETEEGYGALWVDAALSELNGPIPEDGGMICVGLVPKFGYYLDGSSGNGIRINGNESVVLMNFGAFVLVFGSVSEPVEMQEVIVPGIAAVSRNEIAEPEVAETEAVETETEPMETEAEAMETEAEPIETEAMPEETEAMETEAAPEAMETEAMPVETEAMPVETEAMPVETEAMPVETEAMPVETEAMPAETEAAPMATEAMPAATEAAPALAAASETEAMTTTEMAETEMAPAETEAPAAPSDTGSVFGGGGIVALIVAAALAVIGVVAYRRRKNGDAA